MEAGISGISSEAPGVLSRRYRALTLGIISVVSLIAFEASAVNTAMPSAARALDGIELYAFAFSAFFTASLFAMVLSGEWCDRAGPRAPLFTGIAAFGAGLLIAGSAQRMWMFVAGRGVQGIGAGLVIVALYVTVGRAYPERLRPAVMASFSAAWVVPVIVGPLVAGSVTEGLGWRWVFLAIPVLILPPLAVMLPALRRVHGAGGTGGRGRMDRRRILLALGVAAGAGLLQYAAQEPTPLSVVPAAAGLALLVPCVLRLLPSGTFRAARGLPAVVLVRLSREGEEGANSAALQVSDALGSVVLVGLAGALFVGFGAEATPARAFGAVFAVASLCAAAGIWAGARQRPAA
ncbi:MFS transporter [Streptomyces sp. NPDC049577]|uniref:MFS transporter n=1 Tax=Streptomyces sp. NPDC049577 TaxID=3155153 RepID=UPI00343C91CE